MATPKPAGARGDKFTAAPRLDSTLRSVPNVFNCHVAYSTTDMQRLTAPKEPGGLKQGVWKPNEAVILVSAGRGIAFLDPNGMLLASLKPDEIDRVLGSGDDAVHRVKVYSTKGKGSLVEIDLDPKRKEGCVVTTDSKSVNLMPPATRVEAFLNALRTANIVPDSHIHPDGKLPVREKKKKVEFVAAPEIKEEAPPAPVVEVDPMTLQLFEHLRLVEEAHAEGVRLKRLKHVLELEKKEAPRMLSSDVAYNLAMLIWDVTEQRLDRHFDGLARRSYLAKAKADYPL